MRVFLAPVAAEQPGRVEGPVEADWKQHLSENGLSVIARHFGWKDDASNYLRDSAALVLPSTSFNGDGHTALMSFDTVHAINAATQHGIPLFAEQPIAASFGPLQQEFPADKLIKKFAQVVHELGETVIGHDISMLQRELGGNNGDGNEE